MKRLPIVWLVLNVTAIALVAAAAISFGSGRLGWAVVSIALAFCVWMMPQSSIGGFVEETIGRNLKERKDEMSDIEKKKSAFMALLKKRAEIWNVRDFYRLVENWFEDNNVDENGIADIKVSWCTNADLGDELFDTMYEVESRLKCSTDCIKMQYRHEPKTIDGVAFLALANTLDINWRVDIGAISVDEDKKDEEKK